MNQLTYLSIQIVPTLFLAYVIPVVAMVLFVLPGFCVHQKCEGCLEKFRNACRYFVGYILGFVEYKDEGSNSGFIVFGYIAPRFYGLYLFTTILLLLETSSAVFLDKFIFTTSTPSECPLDAKNSLYSCFSNSLNASVFDYPLNCSDIEYLASNNINSFQCYQFVFDYAGAAGDATGLFAVSGSIMAFIIWVILKVTEGRQGIKKGSYCKIFFILFLQHFSPLLITVGTIALQSIPVVEDFLTSDIDKFLRLYSLYFALAMSLVTPWYIFKKKEEYENIDIQNAENGESTKLSGAEVV